MGKSVNLALETQNATLGEAGAAAVSGSRGGLVIQIQKTLGW